jgi:hypothetical protein
LLEILQLTGLKNPLFDLFIDKLALQKYPRPFLAAAKPQAGIIQIL